MEKDMSSWDSCCPINKVIQLKQLVVPRQISENMANLGMIKEEIQSEPRYGREELWSGEPFTITRQMVNHGSSGNVATIVSSFHHQWTGNNSFEERKNQILWAYQGPRHIFFLQCLECCSLQAGYCDAPIKDLKLFSGNLGL